MEKDNVALTPPMGWNSWDCYGPAVNEEQLQGNAQYMADHLKEYGWEYVCCDIQWSEPTAGKVSPYYVPFAWLTLDEYGRQLPAVERFPSAAGGQGLWAHRGENPQHGAEVRHPQSCGACPGWRCTSTCL